MILSNVFRCDFYIGRVRQGVDVFRKSLKPLHQTKLLKYNSCIFKRDSIVYLTGGDKVFIFTYL